MREMKRKRHRGAVFGFFPYFALISLIVLFMPVLVRAAECHSDCGTIEECQRFIDECGQVLELYQSANLKNKQTLQEFETQVRRFEQMMASASQKISSLETKIIERAADLEIQRLLLGQRIRRFYIYQRTYSGLTLFFASKNSAHFLRQLFYQQLVANEDKKAIEDLSRQLDQLQGDREKLKGHQAWLAKKKKEMEKQAAFLRQEIEKAEAYINVLSSTIAGLSAKQKQLIELKTRLFSTSVGETPAVDDPCSGPPGSTNFCSPGFSPAFAAFSFGAPHRQGMSQYGALGRAQAGQDYQTILKAYYGEVEIKTTEMPAAINTSLGSLSFETNYLLGIAEMPSSWGETGGMEALKAQAIAARTYALAYVGWRLQNPSVKGSICLSEACQVYRSAKAANPPATWRRAVEETRGQIIVSKATGEIISAWYASTAGGYLYSYTTLNHQTPAHWDTSCGHQGCWPNEAWEKKANSPWFYKAWYRTRSGKDCGRSHPWLTQEEWADIINALIVYTHDQGTISHLSQPDAASCWGKTIPETWSKEQLRAEANRFGGPVSVIDQVAVDYNLGGYTQKVRIKTDKGELTFSADDFKQIFNLRAPGAIHLKSRLFNLVKL